MPALRAALTASACVLLACIAACTGSPSGPAPAGTSTAATSTGPAALAPAPVAQLTLAQAGSIFAEFLPRFDRLSSDPSMASQLTTGPETAVETFAKGHSGPAVGALTGERYLVPYLTTYPRWFLATGSASTQQGFLFVMVQQSAGASWREAAELYDLTQPQIVAALGAAGFKASTDANPVTGDDVPLTTEPSALSAAYARYLDDGGLRSRGHSFLPGTYTTAYIKSNQQAAASAAAGGWKFADVQAAANLPTYALQLPSGAGAIVIFYTRDTASWTATSSSAKMPTATTTTEALPPLPFLQQLGITTARAGLRVAATAIDENLAFVGPPGTGGAAIVVNDGRAFAFTKN